MNSEAASRGSGPAEEAYTSKEKWLIITAACLGWGLEFFDLMLLSFLAPQIIEEFGVSTGLFGAVFTTQLVATAVGGVLFGWLADIYGRRRVLTWTILVFSIPTALVAFAPSIAWLFVFRFITGMGTGGEWAVGFSLLNEAWTPRRRGLAGGVVQASLWPGFALGIFVANIVPDWRWAFAIGLIPALAALWVRYYCPESKQWLEYQRLKSENRLPEEVQERGQKTELWQIFGADVWKLTALGTAVVFGAQYSYYVYSSWMPTFLQNTLGYSSGQAANILYASAGISFVAYVAAGYFGDFVGRRNSLFAFAAVQLAAFALFAILNASDATPSAIVGSYFLISLGLGYFAIFGVWFGELFPTRIRASGSSFCYSVGRGIASIGPFIVGVLAANYGLGGGISTGVLSVLLMIIFAGFMQERKGRKIVAVE